MFIFSPKTLIFSVTASIMTAEWTITSDGIKLNAMQGGTTNALNDVIGNIYPIKQMIKILRSVSCDIFPDDDAFYYVDQSCEKNAIMEFHLYSCMGIMCGTHNFSWSRWNQHMGSRTCVLLMREIIEHRKLVSVKNMTTYPKLKLNIFSASLHYIASNPIKGLHCRLYRSRCCILRHTRSRNGLLCGLDATKQGNYTSSHTGKTGKDVSKTATQCHSLA